MISADSQSDPYDLQLSRKYEFEGGISISIQEHFNCESAGLGGTVWSSSVKMAEFLASEKAAKLISNLLKGERLVVCELGAGSTGLCGLVAYNAFAHSKVYFSDLEASLESLFENISENIPSGSRDCWKVMELDWSKPVDLDSFEELGLPNLILAAECLYNVDSVSLFLNVVEALSAPCLLTGIIGESVFDHFIQLCKTRNFKLTCICKDQQSSRDAITPRSILLIERQIQLQ